MIDLHSHSTASDGTFTPCELVEYAKSKNVSVLALTDHDTVSGLQEASVAATKFGIQFIPGIELQIQWPTGEFHLLGLGLKSIAPEMEKIISLLQNGRNNRNNEIISLMQEKGFGITIEELKEKYSSGTIGRPHIAAWMVDNKVVKKRQEAFNKYLGKGRPFFVPRIAVSLDEAIVAINECGGVPVIAHPLSLYVSWGKIEGVLKDVYDRGVEGLEAWHPGARVTDCLRLEEIAKKLGFFITAGSDYHGKSVRPDREIGKTAGGRLIEKNYFFNGLQPVLQKRGFQYRMEL